ncbi:hypothetical protein [Segeticoccus rhizosphaerae]|uniref:hypothetical protein n=1 Tax=Segeticoccus rhizosphaerae TaxID=1104777 RepID=UPI0012645CF5|nr:hypothetical protein [Segeticoccus rhizosphaerae]
MTNSEQRRRGYRGVMAVCLVGGLAYLAVGVVTGQVWFGVFGLAIMLTYAGWLTWRRGRTEEETILAGEGVDERQQAINARATVAMGNLMLLAVLAGFFISLFLQWDSGVWVFGGLAAFGGVSYAAALAFYLRRS